MTRLPRMISAVLTEVSQKWLREKIGEPQYKKIYCHHVTMAYKPTEQDVLNLEKIVQNGQEVVIKLGRKLWANGVEAVEAQVIEPQSQQLIPIKNSHPHITISTDNKPPVLSNDMLSGKGEFTNGFDGAQLIGGHIHAIIVYEY